MTLDSLKKDRDEVFPLYLTNPNGLDKVDAFIACMYYILLLCLLCINFLTLDTALFLILDKYLSLTFYKLLFSFPLLFEIPGSFGLVLRHRRDN